MAYWCNRCGVQLSEAAHLCTICQLMEHDTDFRMAEVRMLKEDKARARKLARAVARQGGRI